MKLNTKTRVKMKTKKKTAEMRKREEGWHYFKIGDKDTTSSRSKTESKMLTIHGDRKFRQA